jgi:hypothetical protein
MERADDSPSRPNEANRVNAHHTLGQFAPSQRGTADAATRPATPSMARPGRTARITPAGTTSRIAGRDCSFLRGSLGAVPRVHRGSSELRSARFPCHAEAGLRAQRRATGPQSQMKAVVLPRTVAPRVEWRPVETRKALWASYGPKIFPSSSSWATTCADSRPPAGVQPK